MKCTLITGASGGIGEATAREFAAKKHNLVLVARNEKKLKQICDELSTKFGITAKYIITDLSQVYEPQHVFEECKKQNLQIDVLINNAGIGSSGEFTENELKTELEIIQINNYALVALTHLFLQDMKQKRNGTIINIASMIAYIPSAYMSVYAGSKHFVKAFTISLTEECKLYGVHVMLFSPGLTTSDFMNTKANDNNWGKVLTGGVKTQTPAQVASELVTAFDKKSAHHISGSRNRTMLKVTKLIPDSFMASSFAKQKQKQMGLNK